MKTIPQKDITAFRRKLLRFYELHGRVLPFRNTRDPYKIAISELMLQQTQVTRVIPKWNEWVRRFPTTRHLARAPRKAVLRAWSGLGYNRRAVYAHELAKTIEAQYGGTFPTSIETLEGLPGIGPYTARAILIFAGNTQIATIDTNIRRVLIHEFHLPPSISMRELTELAERLVPKEKSRDWHNALMDYSSLILPKRIQSIPPRTRQTAFKGSIREIRGEIIRSLTLSTSVTVSSIARRLKRTPEDTLKASFHLEKEGMVRRRGGTIFLAN